jgi:adenylate cyclase
MGEQQVKNIARPVHAHRVRIDAAGAAPPAASAEPPPLPLPDKPSIAILPFQNMSGDPDQEYFADGMVEDIITALSKLRWFFVIARNSTFAYKGKSADVRQVTRELGVRYVLEGSVRKAGNRVRITAQLIDSFEGAPRLVGWCRRRCVTCRVESHAHGVRVLMSDEVPSTTYPGTPPLS